jgi:aerobic-type carbon monoxide dehydrogenase small subunit (CoxS/CutS family)
MATMNISFVLNGKPVSVDVEPATLLCDLLREKLGLTGRMSAAIPASAAAVSCIWTTVR